MTQHEKELRRALRKLIDASDDLESAMSGVTDQFEPELSRLSGAASDAEKVLKNARPMRTRAKAVKAALKRAREIKKERAQK